MSYYQGQSDAQSSFPASDEAMIFVDYPLTSHFGAIPVFSQPLYKINREPAAFVSVALVAPRIIDGAHSEQAFILELSTQVLLDELGEFDSESMLQGCYDTNRMYSFVHEIDRMFKADTQMGAISCIPFKWDSESASYKARGRRMHVDIEWSDSKRKAVHRSSVKFRAALRSRTEYGSVQLHDYCTPFYACSCCPTEGLPHPIHQGAAIATQSPTLDADSVTPNHSWQQQSSAPSRLMPSQQTGSQQLTQPHDPSESCPSRRFVQIQPRPAQDSQTSGDRLARASDSLSAPSQGTWHNAMPSDFTPRSASASRQLGKWQGEGA